MKILCCTYTPVVTGNMKIEFGCKSIEKSGLIVNPRFSSFYVVKRAHQLYTSSENSGKCKVCAHKKKKKGATENYFIWYVLKHFRFANQPPKGSLFFLCRRLNDTVLKIFAHEGYKSIDEALSMLPEHVLCVQLPLVRIFLQCVCVCAQCVIVRVCVCVCAVIGNGEQVSAISPCSPLIPYSPRPFLW